MNPFDFYKATAFPTHLVTEAPEKNFIIQSLNFPQKLRLVFRASEHELSLSKYHQLCDNLVNTLTIIKTEHGKLIGAFTPLRLKSKQGRDRSNKTFLMAINLREKL